MRLGGLLLATLLIAPRPASADLLTSAVFHHGTLGDNGFPNSFTTVCSQSTTNSPLSITCADSRVVGTFPQIGSFSGAASATGSTTGQISLGSSTSLDAWRVNGTSYFASGDRYFAAGHTRSTISDTVTILGAGTVASGYLRLTFAITGGITKSWDVSTLDGFNPTPVADTFFAVGSASIRVNSVGAILTGPGTVTINVPLVFGTPQELALTLATSASASILFSEGYRVVVDFGNTATLADAAILNANREPISGASLLSTNGFAYGPLTAPDPVAEPADLVRALIATVDTLSLHDGVVHSLKVKLANAVRLVEMGATGEGTCGMLGAFAREVQALSGKGLTSDQASQLLDANQRIMKRLGC